MADRLVGIPRLDHHDREIAAVDEQIAERSTVGVEGRAAQQLDLARGGECPLGERPRFRAEGLVERQVVLEPAGLGRVDAQDSDDLGVARAQRITTPSPSSTAIDRRVDLHPLTVRPRLGLGCAAGLLAPCRARALGPVTSGTSASPINDQANRPRQSLMQISGRSIIEVSSLLS